MQKYKGTYYQRVKYWDGVTRQTLFSVTAESGTGRRGKIVEVHSIKQVEKPNESKFTSAEKSQLKASILNTSKNLKSFYTLKEI